MTYNFQKGRDKLEFVVPTHTHVCHSERSVSGVEESIRYRCMTALFRRKDPSTRVNQGMIATGNHNY